MLKKVQKHVILLVSVTLYFLTACQEPNELGLTSLDKTQNNSFFNDTSTVVAFSALEDAVKSDSSSRNLVGAFKDPYFGTTEAAFAFQILPESVTNFTSSTVVNSAVLRLHYAASNGNTASPVTLKIYELTEQLSTTSQYYSNHPIAVEPSPLKTYTFTPATFISQLSSTPYIEIKLPISLAQKIVLLGSDPTQFLNGFRGFYVTCESTSDGSILSFDLKNENSKVVVYYNSNANWQNYRVTSQCEHLNLFNHHLYADATALLKKQIIDKDTLAGDSLVFIQSMAGVKAKLYFPFIKKWAEQKASISQAELVLPIANTDLNIYAPPAALALSRITDSTLAIISDAKLYTIGGTYDALKKEYRFNVSRYIQDLILGIYEDKGLSLVAGNYGVSANRVVIKGNGQTKGLRLEIKYSK